MVKARGQEQGSQFRFLYSYRLTLSFYGQAEI